MTRGLGTALNNEGEWNQLVDVIESRFNEYLDQETITSRRSYTDRRIHACLYLVAPTGHW
jgi:septin 7